MQYVDTIIWSTGVVAWIWLAIRAGTVLGRVAGAAVVATDVVRWRQAIRRVHGDRAGTGGLIGAASDWLWAWCKEIAGDDRSVFCGFGRWDGPGKWSIYSPVDIRKD